MNNSDARHKPALDTRRSRLWFGTSLTQFLKAELKDSPGRQVAAFRLFIVSLVIVLASQSLHLPPLGAIALLICLSYDPYANAGQSLAFGLRQLGYILFTTLISVFALVLAGNEAWLLLPVSFIILALALFHARLIAWPTGIALWYSVAVLYSPSAPDEAVYNALWNIPIIGVLAIGSWTVVHLTVKPQDPFKQLKASIAEQLASVECILSTRLADSGVTIGHNQVIAKLASAGSFGNAMGLLANAELIHPAVRKRHDTYLALLLEIDSLRQTALWLDQALTAEYRAQPMNQEKLDVYLALQGACAALRQGVEEWRDVSGQIKTLLADDVLHRYALTHPSILTAIWRVLERIAGLMHDLHKPASPSGLKTQEAAANNDGADSWLPAWLGYDFWAAHADSLQFGIKFSLGAILCTLFVESLGWPGINTAIPTCLVAAQTSLGADYRLSILRLSGAFLGGLSAYLYVLVFQSQLDTIAGFLLATAPVWAISAWISSGSERIAYLGRQFGFSFALFVLHDFGPVTDLYLPRDRVIGILLGIIVMGVIDYALWPRRSIALARHHGAAALHTLARLTARLPDPGLIGRHTLPLRLSAEKELAAAQNLVMHAVLEPDAGLIHKADERTALNALIKDASNLSGLLLIRKRYRLLSGQQFARFPDALQQHSRAFDAALASELENAALALQGEQREIRTEAAAVYARLQQSYIEYHRIDGLPADMAMEWELRFMLDHQIMGLVGQIQKSALDSVSYRLQLATDE